MDDADAPAAAEEAWAAACDVLDDDGFDAAGLAVLEEAYRVLASFGDAESRERRAQVLEGIAICHVRAGDGAAAAAAVGELLGGTWPEEVLPSGLNAALIVVASGLLSDGEAADVAARAVEVGEASDDDDCRALVAELLKRQAYAVMADDLAQARVLLSRVVDEFGDVDDPSDSAEDRLEDPYFRGLELMERPGQLAAAEALFRQSVEEGHSPAWLELAIVLSRQPGRDDDEERALRAALDAQTHPERLAIAGNRLGRLLHFGRGDRVGAREAFGRATTGTGGAALNALQELAAIAVMDRDHEARRQLVAELAGRALEEYDEDARRKDHAGVVAASRLGYARPLIAVRAWRWRRARRREQRRWASS